MFHHHILNLEEDETVRRIYEKQKESCLKGDWIELVREDFKFMNIDMDENQIRNYPKEVYRQKIKKLIRKAAFKEMIEKKNSLSKIKDIKYKAFAIQSYLKSKNFNCQERNLLYSLRSRMYDAKNNFRKLHLNNLKCYHGCNADEDQRHIFEQCEVLKSNTVQKLYDLIFEDVDQKKASHIHIHADRSKKKIY